MKSSGICEGSQSRVGIDILSKSKIVVSPQSVGGSYPSGFPSGLGAKEVLPQQGLPFPSSNAIPQQGGIGVLTSSSAECLELFRRVPERDTFYAFIMKNSIACCIEK